MSINVTPVQANSVRVGGASASVSFTNTPAQGNALFAVLFYGVTAPVGDVPGFTKVIEGPTGRSQDGAVSIWKKSAGATESKTVTATATGSAFVALQIFEYAGVDVVGAAVTGSNTSGTATTQTLAAASSPLTVPAGSLVLAAFGVGTGVTGAAVTNGYTLIRTLSAIVTAGLVPTTSGPQNTTLSITSAAVRMGSVVAAFAPVPTGAPTSTAAPAVTGTPAVGQVLTVDNGAWDQAITSYTRQWQRDGVDISGATGTTYTVTSADAGHTLRAVVTATSSNGTTSANSNGVAIPAAPFNTVAPVVTTDGTPATGETITCSTGTWTGTGVTYTYQWYRGASPITGETTNAYVLAVTDEGASITCRVTATNGGGTATANSNAITPAVTAPLSDASFLTYLSGGTGNTDPALSIGGARGGTYTGGLNALIGPILGSVAQAGGTFYRVVYIRNTHTTATAAGLKLFIESQFTHPGLTVAAAVPAEAAGTDVPALASGTTAPTGVTWVTTTDPAAGAAFGNLGPGQQRGVYLRFTIASGTPLTSQADATVAVDGTAA